MKELKITQALSKVNDLLEKHSKWLSPLFGALGIVFLLLSATLTLSLLTQVFVSVAMMLIYLATVFEFITHQLFAGLILSMKMAHRVRLYRAHVWVYIILGPLAVLPGALVGTTARASGIDDIDSIPALSIMGGGLILALFVGLGGYFYKRHEARKKGLLGNYRLAEVEVDTTTLEKSLWGYLYVFPIFTIAAGGLAGFTQNLSFASIRWISIGWCAFNGLGYLIEITYQRIYLRLRAAKAEGH